VKQVPVSAHDVARELRQRLPGVGVLKLHKLLYYCQGWYITWAGEAMFTEAIEAWDQGPVVADVWHDEKRHRALPAQRSLTDEQAAVIDYVVERYGHESGAALKHRAHREDPWRQARQRPESDSASNPSIGHESLSTWFRLDAAYVRHATEVDRLRLRRDVYGFDGPTMPASLRDATLRVLGHRP
jgi:uncharacterized phage-associated protein